MSDKVEHAALHQINVGVDTLHITIKDLRLQLEMLEKAHNHFIREQVRTQTSIMESNNANIAKQTQNHEVSLELSRRCVEEAEKQTAIFKNIMTCLKIIADRH